ncbi:MAG: hypothetical protein WCO00_04855 [Rhodospirillaceae bacterium]
MASFVIAFDTRTHTVAAEKRIQSLEPGHAWKVLDSVWFLRTRKDGEQIYEHVNSALGAGDRLIVVESAGATYRDLLTPATELLKAGL